MFPEFLIGFIIIIEFAKYQLFLYQETNLR